MSDTHQIQKTIESLAAHHFDVVQVNSKAEALEEIKKRIPDGASVMNGSSETLREIGYLDYVKANEHGWDNLHATIVAEKDPAKQQELRNEALFSQYYLGSAHAVTQDGQVVIASNTGSQLSHMAYTSPHSILVVGNQKIVPDLASAFKRIERDVIPLEDERMKGVYGYGTTHTKTLVLHQVNPNLGKTVTIILVNEKLGF